MPGKAVTARKHMGAREWAVSILAAVSAVAAVAAPVTLGLILAGWVLGLIAGLILLGRRR